MKDRSWGCSVTRTCLKNTAIDPVGVQERSQDANPTSSKGTTRRSCPHPPLLEAMPAPTIDQSVTSKDGVDASNTLMLRRLAMESFLSGVPRKAGDSGESQCHKKNSTWETLREARSTAVSCKCSSHLGKELISAFPNHTNTTKNDPASFDGGKVTEGVGSLLSRIGLDNRKKPEPELPLFQNSGRFDKVPHHRTQDFLKSIPSKDAGECQSAVTYSSLREFPSISTEQVTSTSRTTMVNVFADKKTSHCCVMGKHSVGLSEADLRGGTVKEGNRHVSWAKEISVILGSAGRSHSEENFQGLLHESGLAEGVHARIMDRKVDANEMITNPQASNFKSSMHTVGHMWCIPEAHSVADAMCNESSPSHRCSVTGHGEATFSESNPTCPFATGDDFDMPTPIENNSLKPHLNSPVHKEAAPDDVVNESSLPNAITKDMQLRISEARNLYSSRIEQHTDSPLIRRGLIRKIFKEEGDEEKVSSKTSWPVRLKTAAHVRWNLRELMQREEIEDDVDANLNALRTAYMPKQGRAELGCLEELARSLIEKQIDAKQEDSVEDCGTPQRHELGDTKVKHEEAQLDDVSRGNRKAEPNVSPNATPRSKLVEERTIQEVEVLEGKIARRGTPQHNHVHSSCPSDSGRNADTAEEDDELFLGKASSPDTRKLDPAHDFRDDSEPVRELDADRGTGRDDLEVLLEFLTMKQRLRENKQSNVQVVVQTEAIVRELLSRMKLDSDCSSSVDSEASVCFLPKHHIGEPVLDDSCCQGRRKRSEQDMGALSTVVTNDATVRDIMEDRVDDSQAISFHQNQKFFRQSRPAIHRPPFVVPSSSKPHSFQRMAGSASPKKSPSFVRHCCDLSEEYRVVTSPSRTPEEARKRSRRSSGGARQVETREDTQSVKRNVNPPAQEHVIDVAMEEVVSIGSPKDVGKGGSSTSTGMESVDRSNGWTQFLGSAENDGTTLSSEIGASTSSQTEATHVSPSPRDPMPQHSTRNLESRTFASSSPAMTPLYYLRDEQLPAGRNFQLASPVKRSTPKSPSSPHRRPYRRSPTRTSSPNNRPSPLTSPHRQLKSRPATATLASRLGSPKPTKLLSKDLADDVSYTLISKPSPDVDIFPAGISEAVVQQSVALAKDSSDPYTDFCDSMLEMMQEKNLWQREEELQDLLQCFLHLNQPVHHRLIHQAFSDVVSFGSPMRYHHKSSRKERSKAHLNHRSSPSRSPSRQLWDVSLRKSPARGGQKSELSTVNLC